MATASASAPLVTDRLYYKDTQLQRCSATVLKQGRDEQGNFVILDRTLFHPQGGGQPLDKGHISRGPDQFLVSDVQPSDLSLKHYILDAALETLTPGCEVEQEIDLPFRKQAAQLHTAGHVLADVVLKRFPKMQPLKGNHFPGGQAFVAFRGEVADKAAFTAEVEQDLATLVEQRTQVIVDNTSQPRTMRIDGFSALPCGGTHLSNLGEVSRIKIRSIKKKSGELRVGYDVV